MGPSSLSENNIDAGGAIAIAEALKVNTLVTQLNLEFNQIGAAGAIAIAEALKVNKSVSQLNLHSNDIDAAGAIAIADSLKINTSVTELNLEFNQIGAAGAIAIAEALKINTSVTELNLSRNNIDAAGAIAIADALKVNKSVTQLNLDYNQIGAAGAIAIADALKVNKSVTQLDLNYNDIGSVEDKAIVGELTINQKFLEIAKSDFKAGKELNDEQYQVLLANIDNYGSLFREELGGRVLSKVMDYPGNINIEISEFIPRADLINFQIAITNVKQLYQVAGPLVNFLKLPNNQIFIKDELKNNRPIAELVDNLKMIKDNAHAQEFVANNPKTLGALMRLDKDNLSEVLNNFSNKVFHKFVTENPLLILKSSNAIKMDKDGETELHRVVIEGSIGIESFKEFLKSFTEKGGDINIKNTSNKTAFDIAQENYNQGSDYDLNLMNILQVHGANIAGNKRALEENASNSSRAYSKEGDQSKKAKVTTSFDIEASFKSNFVESSESYGFKTPVQKVMNLILPIKFNIKSSYIEHSSAAPALTDANDMTPSALTEAQRSGNANDHGDIFYKAILGIKMLDTSMDAFKVFQEPTFENFNILARDVVHLGIPITGANGYALSLSATDIAAQIYYGKYTQAFIQAGTTAGYTLLSALPAILPNVLGVPLAPIYQALSITYISEQVDKVADKVSLEYSNYATPESQLKSNLAYATLSNNLGFQEMAKNYFIDAMQIVNEDFELHHNHQSFIQKLAVEYDLLSMICWVNLCKLGLLRDESDMI